MQELSCEQVNSNMNTNEIPAAFEVRLSIIASERHPLNSRYKEKGIKVSKKLSIYLFFGYCSSNALSEVCRHYGYQECNYYYINFTG